MTIIEQARRILKAAPYLPFQALTGLGILLFGLPIFLHQMFDSVFVRWVKTEATVSTSKGVQDRIRNGEPEYFYSIDYAYEVGGQTFIIPLEGSHRDGRFAEEGLKFTMDESKPITIWFDRANPSKATAENPKSVWPVYVGVLVILVLVLLYFRWLMLKYYELELEGEE